MLVLFGSTLPAQRIQYQAVGTRVMVASAHSRATEAGMDILRKGGNAFDAAVAVAATLNVVEPSRSGMGGVGFMTLADVFATAVEYADQGFPVETRGQALMAADDFFYKGELAQEFAAFYRENDGLFTLKDFADCQPVWAKPIRTTYKEYEVYSNGPTSRGGIQTLMNLNLLESYDLKAMGLNSAEYIHLLAESIKLVNADVYRHVADPKVATVPLDGLLSKAYAAERRKLIRLDQAPDYAALPSQGLGAFLRDPGERP